MEKFSRLVTVQVAVLAAVLAAGSQGCGRSASSDPELVEVRAALATTPQLISLPFPKGASRDSVGFGANGFLKLNDRVLARKTDGSASALSNAGTVTTELGANASSGGITSVAPVNLRTSATVIGNVITSGVLTTQTGATVNGTITQNASLTPLNVFSWTVSLPQQNAGDVLLPPDGTNTLAPGSYANVTVNARAKLNLSAGVYYVNALDVESTGQLVLNKTNGAVIIYVRNTLIYRGQTVDAGGPEGDFLLVYLSGTSASLEQPFTGTVVAPNASLTLASTTVGFRGTFFAHDIEVHQATTVVAVPFNWTHLFGPPVAGPQLPSDPFNPPRIPQGPFGPKLTPTTAPRAFPRTPYSPRLPIFGVGPAIRPGTPAPRPEPRGVTSQGFVDNIGWGYSHEAIDYVTPPGALDEGEPGRLVDLSLRRYYKPGFSPIVSSFGAGMFSNYDTKLRVVSNGAGGFNILSFQIANDLGEVLWTETDADSGDNLVDGIFHTTAGVGQSMRLLTSGNVLTSNPLAAATAVLTEWNGNQTVFELVNTGVDIRSGRLQKELDPNANAVSVAYKFPANATLAQLGNDRTKLWQLSSVTDNHGLTGTFDYAATLVNARWCVSAFHAPNGTTISYAYNPGQVLGGIVGPALSQATFPDGSLATFSTAVEASTNLAIVHVNDRAAAPVFMVKDLYLSQAQMRTASGTMVPQQPNLLRQIINGAGEVAYANWDDSARPGTTYVYEGAGTLLRLSLGSGNVPVAFARASFFDPALAPSQAVFEPVETYQSDDLGRMTAKTDVAGRTTVWERDRLSLVVKGLQFPDGSRQTRTFGGFLRLASLVDRNGNVNQYSYDVRGNVIAAVAAVAQTIASSTSVLVNARGQTTQTTDGRGNVTNYVYDSKGFLTSSTQPPDNPGGPRAVKSYEYDSSGRMTAKIDADGRRETYTYDSRNRLTKTTFLDATTQVVTYGSGATAGLIVSTADRRASVSNITYDPANRIVQRRDGVGTSAVVTNVTTYIAGTSHALTQSKRGELTEFVYDSKGRIVTSTAHPRLGQVLSTRTFYDALGRMNSSSDGYGRRTFFFFDSEDRLLRSVKELVVGGVPGDPGSVVRSLVSNPAYAIEDHFFSPTGDEVMTIDAVGTVTRSEYDSLRRIVQKTEASGTPLSALWQYTYDAVGNLTTLVSPRSNAEEANAVSVYTYNGRNLVSSVTRAPGSAEQSTMQIAYTLTKKKAQITDARGGITRHTYSACCDRLEKVTEPNGAVTTYVSDALGNQLSGTDGNGNRQTTTYDALNRPISSTNGAGEVTTYVYDDNLTDGIGIDPQLNLSGLGLGAGSDGAAVLVTNPLGGKRFKVQDGLGRSVLEKDETGNVTRTAYDVVANGLVETTRTDGLGNPVRDRTDATGNSRVMFDAEGNSVVRAFDAAGRLLLTSDPTGRGTGCTVDALGRTTSCLDTAGDQTSAFYDTEGNQVAAVDALGRQSSRSFDAHNRPTFSQDRLGNTTRLAYDAVSNVTSMTDAEGGVTSFVYDARNLRTQEQFPDGSTITQEYDPAGRLLARTTADGVRVVSSYDGADRLIQRSYPDGTADTFTYDQASRLVKAVSGRYQNTVDRAYDAAGRVTSESITVGGATRTVTSTYDAAGRRSAIGYPDGSRVNQSYTARGLVAAVTVGSQAIAAYNYDGSGRVLGNTLGNGKAETYSYRNDGILATVSIPGVSSLSYQYNADKKVTQELRDGQPFDTFGYDAEQRLVSAVRAGSTQTWELSPEGDWQTVLFNGNVSESRTHNAVHEITSINEGGLTYDARGQTLTDRNGRTFTWGIDGQLTHAVKTFGGTASADFTYDALGRRVTRSVGSVTTVFVNDANEVVAEYDNGTLARSYILGAGVDQPIAMRVGAATYYYARQVNSSIHAVTSDTGAVVERYEYNPYGFRTIRAPDGSVRQTSAIGNSYGFTGRYHDAAVGIIDFRARQYSPDLGRFLNRDDRYQDGMSLYRAYFPPDGTDPTGHWGWDDLNPVNLAKDVGGAVADAGAATVNAVADAGKATVNAVGDAINATGDAIATGAGAIATAGKAVVGAVVYAGTEIANGAEYLGDKIWVGAQWVGSETWKGAVAIGRGAWRLGGEFVDDVWQSVKVVALAYWDVLVTDLVCAWDILQFYGLLFTGHPLDALKKLTAGVGNLAISVFEFGLVFGSVAGGWANPLGLDPATIIGVGIGLVGWAMGGDAPAIHWHNGGFVYEFDNSKIFSHGITLGRAVNLEPGATADERAHEYAHVTQLGLLGPFYLPAHIISQGVSLIASGEDNPFKPKNPDSYKKYNILETGPYYPNHKPWPNIPRIPW